MIGASTERNIIRKKAFESRNFGFKSSTANIAQAKQRCPNLIVVPCRHDYYAKIDRKSVV